MIGKLKLFFEEARQEIKKVNWPSVQETKRYTLFVIGLSIGIAVFLGLLDFGFLQLLEKVVLKI